MNIITKAIISICVSIFSFIVVWFVQPLTERWQGASGYVYENGLSFSLIHICLVLTAFISLGYFMYIIRFDIKQKGE